MRHVTARLRVDTRDVEVALELQEQEVLAILGPNGAGKSTVLSVIAGLLDPDEGRIVLGGRTLLDTAARVAVPAHERGIALLGQQPLLFPHLSVEDNVAFAPAARGRGRRQARRIARARLEAVDATDLAARRPGQLSGGQAQRVALARALAAEPDLFLLDEPMAALDVDVAAAMRHLLREVWRESGRGGLLVTHDLLDVVALADRVAVVDAGRVVETGPVGEVLAAPRSAFAARLAGVNLVPGRMAGPGTLRADAGGLVHGAGGERGPVGEAVALFRPVAVAVLLTPGDGSPRNVWAARVTALETLGVPGGTIRVRAAADGIGQIAADITAAAAAELALSPGRAVHLVVKAQEVALHEAWGRRDPASLPLEPAGQGSSRWRRRR